MTKPRGEAAGAGADDLPDSRRGAPCPRGSHPRRAGLSAPPASPPRPPELRAPSRHPAAAPRGFGIEIGSVDKQDGLRPMWRDLLTNHAALVAGFRPGASLPPTRNGG